MQFFTILKFLLSIYLFVFLNNGVYASAIEVSPTKVFFQPDQKFTSIIVKNLSKEKVFIQAELLHWQQKDSKNIYNTSKELIISPPLFSIEPESEQVVRIGRKQLTQSSSEQSYRLLLSEIPDQFKLTNGLKIVLRLNLPIFITPKETTQHDLKWSRSVKNNQVTLSIYNPNNTHRMVNKVELKDKLNKSLYEKQNAFIYLLPKQKYTWQLNKDSIKTANLGKINDVTMQLETQNGLTSALAMEENLINNDIRITQNQQKQEQQSQTS